MKKGNNSSNIWALRQIADFMASTSHAVFPTSSMSMWCLGSCQEQRWRGGWGGEEREEQQEASGCQATEQAAYCVIRPWGAQQQPERYLALLLMLIQIKHPQKNYP